MQIFLDCDGVLADFDAYAEQLLGLAPREFEKVKGDAELWNILYSHDDYFYKLPKMKDADELVDGVRAMGFEPTILTGIPSKEGSDWAIGQKQRWAADHFPGTEIICCKSRAKFEHMVQGKRNVLIDDWDRYLPIWENAGGKFILHTSAADSLRQLREFLDEIGYF